MYFVDDDVRPTDLPETALRPHAAIEQTQEILICKNMPAELLLLPPREREIAYIVFDKEAVTAIEVCRLASKRMTNGAVRTMLMRLVRKGVIRRHRSGYGKTFLYVPAIPSAEVEDVAFRRLAEDFFNGSLDDAATAMRDYLSRLPCREGAKVGSLGTVS